MIKDEAIQRIKTAWQDEFGCPMTGDETIARTYSIAIRALMDADKPLPVDPDLLLLVRKIVADEFERAGWPAMAAQALAGVRDDSREVRIALAGIKAGKAMR